MNAPQSPTNMSKTSKNRVSKDKDKDLAESSKTRKSIKKTRKEVADDQSQSTKIDLMNQSAYGFSPGEKSQYGKSSYKGRGSIRKSSSKSKEADILFEKIQKQAEELKSDIAGLKDDMVSQKRKFTRIEDELVDFNQMDCRQKFDMKQRAMLKKVFTEFMTPVEMNMNVDFK